MSMTCFLASGLQRAGLLPASKPLPPESHFLSVWGIMNVSGVAHLVSQLPDLKRMSPGLPAILTT